MELKQHQRITDECTPSGFNRTFMELKQMGYENQLAIQGVLIGPSWN